MSKWLITLTYHFEKESGGSSAQYISAVTVNYQHSENHFVKFAEEYPTESEINKLIEKHTIKKEFFNRIRQEYETKKTVPTITFMQKLCNQ